jgi:hypothetical protein
MAEHSRLASGRHQLWHVQLQLRQLDFNADEVDGPGTTRRCAYGPLFEQIFSRGVKLHAIVSTHMPQWHRTRPPLIALFVYYLLILIKSRYLFYLNLSPLFLPMDFSQTHRFAPHLGLSSFRCEIHLLAPPPYSPVPRSQAPMGRGCCMVVFVEHLYGGLKSI